VIIDIKYNSCWQNSFLDDKEKKIAKTGGFARKFNKSKANGNAQPISKNTILGVLYRLIGEQRTLKEIQNSDYSYFKDIEEKITFDLLEKQTTENELVMLINKDNSRTGQGNYIGVIKDDTALFFSKNAPKLWSVLYLSIDEITSFINKPSLIKQEGSSMPRDILNRIDKIEDKQETPTLKTIEKLLGEIEFGKQKQEERLKTINKDDVKTIDKIKKGISKSDEKIKNIIEDIDINKESNLVFEVLSSLEKHFSEIPKSDYLKKGVIYQMGLYAAALYLQADLLEKSGEDISELYVFQEKGGNKGKKTIHGFSKKGFNGVRDFLNKFSTGGSKKTVKTPFSLRKENGKLSINLKIEDSKAEEINNMINSAGVSSFYLGKKGLAFVDSIEI
jgi:hypothetical protein